jgi:hypothetical protein
MAFNFNKNIKYFLIILAFIVIFYSFYNYNKISIIEGNSDELKNKSKDSSTKKLDIMHSINI